MASSIYPFAADLTKQAPRGIAKVYVKKAADTGYSSLGDIRNGKAHVRLTGTQNSRKRTNPFSAIAEHEFSLGDVATLVSRPIRRKRSTRRSSAFWSQAGSVAATIMSSA